MKAVVQRVREASVEVDGQTIGSIGPGLVVLLGIAGNDSEEDVDYLAEKITNLRIFQDAAGKMNLSLGEINGSVLVISQFTLLADTRKGRRPSFIQAAPPELAEPLYDTFVHRLESQGLRVACGIFGAHMLVKIFNDGPVTLVLDSADRFRPRKSSH